jgi:hypothetical protein
MRSASHALATVAVLIGSLTLPSVVHAQAFDSVGVRAQGMGGAFVAVADDASATWWNPAGLASGPYFDALLELGRTQAPADDRPGGTAVPAERTEPRGLAAAFPALGLSYYRLRLSQIQPAAAPIGEPPAGRQDQGTANVRLRALVLQQFGATVGQSLGEHLVLGATVKLVRGRPATALLPAADASLDRADELDGEAEIHGDVDVGVMARFGPVHLGLAVRNMTRPAFGADTVRVQLNRQARAGVSLSDLDSGAMGQLTLALDTDLTRRTTALGDERRVAAGVEDWFAGRRIGVRGGIGRSTVGDARTAVSGGLSLGLTSRLYLEGAIVGGRDVTRHGWDADLRVTF